MPPKHSARAPRRRLALAGILATAALVTLTLWTLGGAPRTLDAGLSIRTPPVERSDSVHRDDDVELSVLDSSPGSHSGSSSTIVLPASAAAREQIDRGSTLTVRTKVARYALVDASIRVLVDGRAIGAPSERRSDRRGRARFEVPPETDVTVEVTHARLPAPVRKAIRTATSEGTRTIVFQLADHIAPVEIAIDVVSLDAGVPLDGATVAAFGAKRGGERPSLGKSGTEESGRARIPWERGGRVKISAPGHSSRSLAMPRAPEDLEVGLYAHAWIHGDLNVGSYTLASAPDRDVRLGLVDFPSSEFTEVATPIGTIDEVDRPSATQPSLNTRDGRPWIDARDRWLFGPIEFRGVEPEVRRFDVIVSIEGDRRAVAHGVVVRPGDDKEIDDLFADARPLDLQLRYDGAFDPPGAWSLRFVPAGLDLDHAVLTATATPTGRVALAGPPVGRWDIYRVSKYGQQAPVAIATFEHRGEPDCVAILREHVPLRGAVTGAADRGESEEGPATMTQVLLIAEGRRELATCDAEGLFDLSPVLRGATVRLEVMRAEGVPATEEEKPRRFEFRTVETWSQEVVADGSPLSLRK